MSKKFDWGKKVSRGHEDRTIKHNFTQAVAPAPKAYKDIHTLDIQALRAQYVLKIGGKK